MRLDALLRPRSIAVLGASERPSIGRTLIESLDRLGFPGAVYPINPKYEQLLGKRCYPSVADLPPDVDAVAFCINHTHALEHVRLAAERRVGAIVIFDGGFGEAGPDGRRAQDEIAGLCREAGIALCGPNCMGVVNPHDRSLVYLQPVRDPAALAGNVGLVSQSGSICINLLADCRRFAWSHVISSGNEAVVDAAQFIEFLADDPETRVIATFTESVRDPDRFVAALDRAADRGKPVVVLKAGKSEQTRRAIASHTGGLAGESRAFSAVLRAHRAVEVADLDEMTEVLAACQGERWPRGRRLFVLTASGGLAELILDLAGPAGVSLPPLSPATRAEVERVIGPASADGNPLDAWGHGDFARNFPHALAVAGADPGFDAIALCNEGFDDQPIGSVERMLDYARILAEAARASDKPFYFATTRPGVFRRDQVAFLKERGIPVICGTRQGFAAIDRLARWAQPLPAPRPERRPALRLAALLGGRRRATVHEHDAKRLLASAGVTVARERLAPDLGEARRAAADLGYPVVLKAVSDDIPHRAEHGLVAVGLRDEGDLERAWGEIAKRLAALGPRGAAAALLVQEMIAGGVEVLAGVSRDPHFGPAMAFGAGGVLVEALDDVALRALPLRPGDARAMVAETRVARLLAGGGRRPPADLDALCDTLERIADLAWAERERLAELDVNPILVREAGQGCVVVDALIVPRAGAEGA